MFLKCPISSSGSGSCSPVQPHHRLLICMQAHCYSVPVAFLPPRLCSSSLGIYTQTAFSALKAFPSTYYLANSYSVLVSVLILLPRAAFTDSPPPQRPLWCTYGTPVLFFIAFICNHIFICLFYVYISYCLPFLTRYEDRNHVILYTSFYPDTWNAVATH